MEKLGVVGDRWGRGVGWVKGLGKVRERGGIGWVGGKGEERVVGNMVGVDVVGGEDKGGE